MSLFIGNISNKLENFEISKYCNKFGRCSVDRRVN